MSSKKKHLESTVDMPTTQYRLLTKDDQEIVWNILMHAAHETDVNDVKANPQLAPYAQSFGHQTGDQGVVAFLVQKDTHHPEDIIGAAWVRTIPEGGYATALLEEGHPVKELPEVAIACLPDHRGKGIGTALMKQLIQQVEMKQSQSCPGICLSCRTDNAALRLYKRLGFVHVPDVDQTNRVGGTSITMAYMFDRSCQGNGEELLNRS